MRRLEDIKEGLGRVSVGPWAVDHLEGSDAVCDKGHGEFCVYSKTSGKIVAHETSLCSGGDSWFIANSRQDVPWLIAEVERLRGLIERFGRHPTDLNDEMCVFCKARWPQAPDLGHAINCPVFNPDGTVK